MNKIIKNTYNLELKLGKEFYSSAIYEKAFYHFERAHILGQLQVIPHTRVHLWMLRIGIKTFDVKEIFGQMIRIPLGIIGSLIGHIPTGNTGRSNVNALRKMDIPYDLLETLNGKNNT